jgi:hypothetical protein
LIHAATFRRAGAGYRRHMGATIQQEIGASASGLAVIPLVGPFMAAAASLISAFNIGGGCGGTCINATNVVNAIAPLMSENLQAAKQTVAAYGCLTPAEAAQGIQNFNSLWSQMTQGCEQVGGTAGENCINDRSPGGKTDWWAYYLTPIQNMPVCPPTSVTQPAAAATPGTAMTAALSTAPATSSIDPNILIFAALGLGAVLLLKK